METIKIYNGPSGAGPNPWKVVIVCKELSIPWEFIWIPYADLVKEPYLSLNPNGRFPTMIDPNTNVTLFESGAIIQYLVAQYDTKHLISYPAQNLQDKWAVDSWLMVQMSGQGPMFGQKMWFTHFHQKKNVETAISRYAEQSRRMLKVIDAHLQKRRQELNLDSKTSVWLVGGKCTYADLSFVPWHFLLPIMFAGEEFEPEKEFPEFFRWSQEINKRQSIVEVIDERTKCTQTMENSAAAVLPKRED